MCAPLIQGKVKTHFVFNVCGGFCVRVHWNVVPTWLWTHLDLYNFVFYSSSPLLRIDKFRRINTAFPLIRNYRLYFSQVHQSLAATFFQSSGHLLLCQVLVQLDIDTHTRSDNKIEINRINTHFSNIRSKTIGLIRTNIAQKIKVIIQSVTVKFYSWKYFQFSQ